jgi:hypothetical protein
MILAEATLFANFSAKGEIISDSPLPPPDRVRMYRSAGVCALNTANYTSPSLDTIAPLLLHLEAEFVISRSTPMKCYLLSSTCIRLMLRLGLHRDPSHFSSISVLTGEMRRRMWHFGLQIEMLVSFQLGLPSFMNGISTDTSLPRNVLDQDLALDTTELPAVRPDSAGGPLTYFNWKTTIGQVFGLIAQKTNMSEPISDAEVMRLDGMLNNVWDRVPDFLKMRSLEECVADEPLLVMERMSLCCIYHKAVCVLHRHHMSTDQLDEKHGSFRRSCFDAACRLLDCQAMFFEGTRPGSLLSQYIWFLRPILTGDFLLAAVIVYLGLERGMKTDGSRSDGYQARQLLERSHSIWVTMAADDPSYLKAVRVLSTMLRKASKKTEKKHGYGQPEDTKQGENMGAADANLYLNSLCGAFSLPASDTSLEDDFAWLPSNDDALDWVGTLPFIQLYDTDEKIASH